MPVDPYAARRGLTFEQADGVPSLLTSDAPQRNVVGIDGAPVGSSARQYDEEH
jgi:hypothetical protein